MSRPRAFYYEDYDTNSDPEYLYHKGEADREFARLEQSLAIADQRAVNLNTENGKLNDELGRTQNDLAEAQRTIAAQKDLIRDWQCVYTDALHAKNSAVSELESENAALHDRVAELESQVAAYHAAAARVAGDALRARQDALEEVEVMLRDELGTDWADEFGSLYEAWSKIK
jgi:chromosome segregation ATPase